MRFEHYEIINIDHKKISQTSTCPNDTQVLHDIISKFDSDIIICEAELFSDFYRFCKYTIAYSKYIHEKNYLERIADGAQFLGEKVCVICDDYDAAEKILSSCLIMNMQILCVYFGDKEKISELINNLLQCAKWHKYFIERKSYIYDK